LCDIESLSSRVSGVAIRAAIRKKVKTVSTYNKSKIVIAYLTNSQILKEPYCTRKLSNRIW
jgi:hypothetical protein